MVDFAGLQPGPLRPAHPRQRRVRGHDPGRRVHARDVLHGHWSTRAAGVNFYDGQIRVVAPDGERLGPVRTVASTATGSPSRSSRGRTSSSRTCARSAGRASSTARTRASTAWRRSVDSTRRTGWPRHGPRRPTSASTTPWRPRTAAPSASSTSAWRRTGRGSIELLYAAERVRGAGDRLRRSPRPRADDPDRDAHRGRRHGRGAARHADAPLLDRRARPGHAGQPDRRHDQQLRAHRDVGRTGRPAH